MMDRTMRLLTKLAGFLALLPILWPGSPRAKTEAHTLLEDYRFLRSAEISESFEVEDLQFSRDRAHFELEEGMLSFASPFQDRHFLAVFRGKGRIELAPTKGPARTHLHLLTGKETVSDSFEKAVFWFTDETYVEFSDGLEVTVRDSASEEILSEFRDNLRRSRKKPRSRLEALLSHENAENIEAEILTDLYNDRRQRSFYAFIEGEEYADLRFRLRPDGALPQMPASEEVVLLNLEVRHRDEGIFYLGHLEGEELEGPFSQHPPAWRVDVEHYRIASTLDGEDLDGSTVIEFTPLFEGDRVVRFGLLPSLEVTSVELSSGEAVGFIQEGEEKDGTLYVVFGGPLEKGRRYRLKIDYAGDEVVKDAGRGNFFVGARTSWYPSLNAFSDRATFELTFRFPRRYKLVSVGRKLGEQEEEKWKISKWESKVPLAVAGFNYGDFKEEGIRDERIDYRIEGFATSDLPNYLWRARELGAMSPSRLLDNGMVDAQNSMRLFTHWFGELPYERIAITQQPAFSFGQSWPSLVYLPLVAFLDSTQRWRLMGTINNDLSAFVRGVTAHEVAHQWWGHIVGWETFHDQWLSEGFAVFSAGLFTEALEEEEDFLRFWSDARDGIVEENRYGHRANDVGPIWLGQLLNTPVSPSAYSKLVYGKGGYVLHMIRRMMWYPSTGDGPFRDLMHDFVEQYSNRNPSTSEFQRVVEEHMTPAMDLGGDGTMDWFFDQWVYGTELPSYRLEYRLEPAEEGGVTLQGRLRQSGVSSRFSMLVPIYVRLGDVTGIVGKARVQGSTQTPEFSVSLPRRPDWVGLNAFHDVLASAEEAVELK